MSTNKMATKADLQEMYQRILPYLGGMPEILANKFSKGDMYSADEKMIGQWVDGKPLYQKTISFTTGSQASTTTIATITNLGKAVDIKGFIELTTGTIPIPWLYNTGTSSPAYIGAIVSGTDVRIMFNGSDYFGKSGSLTITYTKSTDSPISIGSDTDYSTDEKIIGTWIDGKPLWQKTVNFGTLPNTSEKEVLHNIQNIDAITNIYCILINPTTGYSLVAGYCGVNTNHTSDTGLGADRSMVKIKTYDDRSAYTGYVTLQYTKTS